MISMVMCVVMTAKLPFPFGEPRIFVLSSLYVKRFEKNMKTKKNMVCARVRARPDQSVTQTKVSVRYALTRARHFWFEVFFLTPHGFVWALFHFPKIYCCWHKDSLAV